MYEGHFKVLVTASRANGNMHDYFALVQFLPFRVAVRTNGISPLHSLYESMQILLDRDAGEGRKTISVDLMVAAFTESPAQSADH